jgi:hypothetical protein
MVVVGPGYLNHNCLPYASDIFYHKNLIYLLPTGFHPIEMNSVIEFPSYCYDHSIAFPKIIWEMCSLYFDNSKAANEALDIIEPLRGKFIKIVATSYPRGRTAIRSAKRLLMVHPSLQECFERTAFDIRFAARELLSHVLFEVFLEDGYKGAVKYLRANSEKPEELLRLVAAVLINRLRKLPIHTLLLYEHTWYPMIRQMDALGLFDKSMDSTIGETDSFDVEHFRYKLFETILLPIFGRCDSLPKSRMIAEVAEKKYQEIEEFKRVCGTIAREVVLLPTTSVEIKQTKLSDMIGEYVTEPLSAIVEQQSKQVQNLLRAFVLNSTVIAGLLAALTGTDIGILGVAAAAGAISTGVRYILRLHSQQKVEPTALLLTGMRNRRVAYEQVERHLNSVSIEQLTLPEDWQSLA